MRLYRGVSRGRAWPAHADNLTRVLYSYEGWCRRRARVAQSRRAKAQAASNTTAEATTTKGAITMEPEAGHYLERLAQLAFGGVEAITA